ncbi:MAG: hypothetical protein K6F23_15055 [Solobacterium sp.]|nr:hypothetical protein [Solobacterium sp.]
MAVNKVVYGNQTLIDLSTDTVASSDDILLGKVGHLRDGSVVTGTASGGDQHGTIWQDGQGYVHLDDESGIALQSKTANPTESQQVIEADEGYYALDKVTVGAISSSYVGSGVSRRSSSDLTVSGATVTAPAGYYSAQASKSVATGTAGTPTATKGTVSNHAVTVTPSVTNTTGYISGGTKTGTGVSVSASELVSGTYSVTSSGTKDVTNYASASVPAGTEGTPTATKGSVSNHSVSVTPSVTNTGGYISGTTKTGTAVTVTASELVSGTKSITQNGTGIDVTTYASVDVTVSNILDVVFTRTGSGANLTLTPNVTFASAKAVLDAGGALRMNTSLGWDEPYMAYYYANSEITINYYDRLDGYDRAYLWDSEVLFNYANVPIMEIPTATKNITQNGTGIDVLNYASVNVAVPTGASNVVFGTFTPTEIGTLTVNIPYTGNGYPIAGYVTVSGGYKGNNTDWNDLIHKYAIGVWGFIKGNPNIAPSYNGTVNDTSVMYYTGKGSTSVPTTYTTSGGEYSPFYSSSNTSYWYRCITLKNKNTLEARINGTNYCLIKDFTYDYCIVYSE